MGRVLQSDRLYADIVKHISEYMKVHLLHSIIELGLKIEVIIDESTTLSKKTALVICFRIVFSDSSEPITFFCDLVKLNNTSASIILGSVLSCLHKHGFT
jgi:hypothetical protein